MRLAPSLARFLLGAAVAGAMLGFAAPSLRQDEPEPYPPCEDVVRMGQAKFMDGVQDLSTAGMRDALGYYTECVDARNQKLIAELPEAKQADLKKLQDAANDLIAGQWDIFGAGGGTMFLLFHSGAAAEVADMIGRILLPGGVEFPEDPEAEAVAKRAAVAAMIPRFEAPVKVFEDEARRSRSDYDREAAVNARQGFRRMVGAWDRLQAVTEPMDANARWTVYSLMDDRLDPDFGR